jgi:hypothetical protein
VIDLSPYWRPTAYAESVVVAGAGQPLLRTAAALSGPHFVPYVAQAVIYRLATTNERLRSGPGTPPRSLTDECERYDRATRVLGAFAREGS